jgi:hypothetical protein
VDTNEHSKGNRHQIPSRFSFFMHLWLIVSRLLPK